MNKIMTIARRRKIIKMQIYKLPKMIHLKMIISNS